MTDSRLRKELSLLDAAMILVGGVIGSGIFLTAGQVAASVRRPDLFILAWIAGGVISLLACFAVAELGGMFPTAGGQYIFLREAYGELPAFLYGWMIFTVVQTGVIAAMSVGFAQYLGALIPALAGQPKAVAIVAIALLTAINIVGLKEGSVLVNAATWAKYGGMATLIVAGLLFGKGSWGHFQQPAQAATADPAALATGFGVALISVLFAYDGWAYVTWVAGEMKDAARNVPRALIYGILAVIAAYVLMNVVYVYALPLDAVIASQAVVTDSAAALFSPRYATALTLMVAVSIFGAMSSAILSTARLIYAMAADGMFFAVMGRVHPRFHTPAIALVGQGIWASMLALSGTYEQLLTYAIFMMILGYLASVGALFVLRRKLPEHPRPYRCIGYPVVPIIYIVIASAWVLNTIYASPRESLIGAGIVLLGIPGFLYWSRHRRRLDNSTA